jgi:3,4-dihydroxy-2-butanone 4-phosphate synthase
MNNKFSSIEEAIEDIKNGKMIIVVDDPGRENEGDLVIAAEKTTPEAINFMVKRAGGLVCTPMEGKDLERLGIPAMVERNTDTHETAFTVSVDHKDTTTGISAFERAKTILELIREDSVPDDFRRPGHIFPLRAKEGGVLKRTGHTEAAVDLAKLAGLKGAGVICEILNEDGTMARVPQLMEFADKHGIEILLEAAVQEAHSVAIAKGIKLSYPDTVGHTKEVCKATAANKSSMLQDILNKKKTEIDMINGMIVQEGASLGISTPVNLTLTNLIRFIQRGIE